MTENELIAKLQIYPELKERLVQLVSIIENVNGDTTLADEAERKVIEEMRTMGHDALQGWAKRQSERVTAQVLEQKNKLRKHIKKNSCGTLLTEK